LRAAQIVNLDKLQPLSERQKNPTQRREDAKEGAKESKRGGAARQRFVMQPEETGDWNQRLRSTDELSKEILCAFATLRETFFSCCFNQLAYYIGSGRRPRWVFRGSSRSVHRADRRIFPAELPRPCAGIYPDAVP
jgi:hypothetical protein